MLRINQYMWCPVSLNDGSVREYKEEVKSFRIEDLDLIWDLSPYYCTNMNNELTYVEVESPDFEDFLSDFDKSKTSDYDLEFIDYLQDWFKSHDVFMADIY